MQPVAIVLLAATPWLWSTLVPPEARALVVPPLANVNGHGRLCCTSSRRTVLFGCCAAGAGVALASKEGQCRGGREATRALPVTTAGRPLAVVHAAIRINTPASTVTLAAHKVTNVNAMFVRLCALSVPLIVRPLSNIVAAPAAPLPVTTPYPAYPRAGVRVLSARGTKGSLPLLMILGPPSAELVAIGCDDPPCAVPNAVAPKPDVHLS
mmetsp:Transcript_49405/g.163649  ORF Transcript_49405/g.163649 Transcript_49405/m.163649 type:complete len:210 (+) Transcript_49405:497-1126(+)